MTLPSAGDRRLRIAVFVALAGAVLSAPSVGALDSLVDPVFPSYAAQGRSIVARAQGFEALFSNPAGFRSQPGEATFLSVSPWLESRLSPGDDLEQAMLDQAAAGGVRFGGSVGFGYAGRGLGLGLLLSGGARVEGTASLAGEADLQLGLAGGYSYAVKVLGMDLALGTAVRPLLRVAVPLDDEAARDLIRASASGGLGVLDALWSEQANFAVGLAVDVGALLDLGPVRLGLLVTDVGNTSFRYSRIKLGDLVTRLALFQGLPPGDSTDEELTVPMELRMGAAWAVTSALRLHAEVRDPLSALSEGLIENLSAGLELKLGKGSALWLGAAGTALSAGASWRLGPLQTSAAVYGLDFCDPDALVPGIAAEAAIRF